ncbi:hypothetical protein FRC09_015835, partial [Ceratobasidium sp. 395]
NHSHRIFLAVCGVKQVQDTKNFEPEYDDNGWPVYWENDILQLHFDLSFEENGKVWKNNLLDSAIVPLGMQEHGVDILESGSRKTFWNALRADAFLSMVVSWKGSCGGKGEERREKKKGRHLEDPVAKEL